MKNKNLIRSTIAIFAIVIISIFLHEFVHVLQLHYLLDIPYSNIEIHYFWEYDTSNQTLIETLSHYRLAWISCPDCTTTKYINPMLYEITAYTIQLVFISIVYFKFIYKNDKFEWR